MENNLVVRQVFDFRTELDGLFALPLLEETDLYQLFTLLNKRTTRLFDLKKNLFSIKEKERDKERDRRDQNGKIF